MTQKTEKRYTAQMLQEDLEFSLKRIQPHIEKLKSGSKVLEVGSGSYLLLAELAKRFPDIQFTGLEPVLPGHTGDFPDLQSIQQSNLTPLKVSYNDFKTEIQFDFIFSIYVLMHLPHWKSFFVFVQHHLNVRGQCVTLCPNYGFPYDGYFGVPVIINKNLTRKLFRQRIEKVEQQHGRVDWWDSYNLVKWGQIRRHCQQIGLHLKMVSGVMEAQAERLYAHPKFAERHKFISTLTKVALKLGVFKLFRWSLFQNFQPYIEFKVWR